MSNKLAKTDIAGTVLVVASHESEVEITTEVLRQFVLNIRHLLMIYDQHDVPFLHVPATSSYVVNPVCSHAAAVLELVVYARASYVI